MKYWAVYDASGQINRLLTGSEPIEAELGGMEYIEGNFDGKDHYVVNGEIIARPIMNISYPSSVSITADAIISNIPAGAKLTYPGGEAIVNDGQVEWSSLVAGTFAFSIELFPFIKEGFSIEVTV